MVEDVNQEFGNLRDMLSGSTVVHAWAEDSEEVGRARMSRRLKVEVVIAGAFCERNKRHESPDTLALHY